MFRLSICALAMAFLPACGSDDGGDSSSATDNLADTKWGLVVGQNGLGIVEFGPAGAYLSRLFVATSAAAANVQVRKGTYTADGKNLTITTTQLSCPEIGVPSVTSTYTVSSETLTVDDPSGASNFTKLTPENLDTSRGYTSTYGCFSKDDGSFTAHDLAP